MSADVTVIIAAYNAEATIALAIASALSEPEVGEVIVVDDCSSDATVDTALRAANGDRRVVVLRQELNAGPAAARNRAMNAASLPFVAILDSDDRFLPGRFARLLASDDWDLCADNIAFSTDRHIFENLSGSEDGTGRVADVDLQAFLAGNRNSTRVQRAELGFLKPVMRREFLDRHGLRYDVECRLGEDFVLYARALIEGARFRVHEACGYAAFERADSLSGQHGVEDLRSYLAALEEMAPRIPASAKGAHDALRRGLREKIAHREVLDIRNERGLVRGLAAMASRPTSVRDIIRDKLAKGEKTGERRVLMPPQVFEGLLA